MPLHVPLPLYAMETTMPDPTTVAMTDIIGPLYHEHDVVTDNRFIQRGYMVAPEGAGLGVTLDEAAVQEYRVQEDVRG
jgi:L-alanine-DL-glutamate epimerase-like enolase superfamily enzyme